MTPEKIIDYIVEYEAEHGNTVDPDDILDYLEDCPVVHEESEGNSRWWENVFTVVKVGNNHIGYSGARTTGDDSPYDKGWEFEQDSLCLVEPRERQVLVTEYFKV